MDTGDAQPVSLYPYRVPIKWKQKIEEEIETLLDNHIIRRSTSPWSSPIVPVAKPDNTVRMCIDYRAVNNVTVVQRYPLPRIDDLLAKISRAKYISSLDLSKGYYQVKLDPETIPKTSFVTHCGKFEFVRLPFGLVNAPAFFQQQMDIVLQHTGSDGYIDDIRKNTFNS